MMSPSVVSYVFVCVTDSVRGSVVDTSSYAQVVAGVAVAISADAWPANTATTRTVVPIMTASAASNAPLVLGNLLEQCKHQSGS